MNRKRLALVIFLTLLPWPAVYGGMYIIRSVVWTFFLYHGVCLLPAIIWGRRLWLAHWKLPARRDWALVLLVAALSCALGVGAYKLTGSMIVSHDDVLQVLTARGFRASFLLPLAFYFIVVNATLEELFWRGVVLNELDYVNRQYRYAGTVWTAAAFGTWHYLVLRALLRPGFAELATAGVICMGFFTSWLYRRSDSIVIPILWHALVFDLAIIALFAVLLHQ
jgi:membrane protease YdiL (CAAX protease family)